MNTASLTHAALTWSAAVSLGLDAKTLNFDAASGTILDRYQRVIDFSRLKGFVEDAMRASHLFPGETNLKYSKYNDEFIFTERDSSSGDLILMASGPTSAIATMRALVIKKAGHRLDIPDAIAFASVKQDVLSAKSKTPEEKQSIGEYMSEADRNQYSMTSSDYVRLGEYKEFANKDPARAYLLLRDAQEKQRPHLMALMKKHKDLEEESNSAAVSFGEDATSSDHARLRERAF